jgi:DNA repair protein RadA/Sms
VRDGKEREKLGTPCPSCKTNIPFGTMRCPRCREWNFTSSDDSEQEVVRLSDARISIVPRLPTLHPQMDIFFGGGLVQTSTMLLGAEPGFGKSTLTLQLADFIIGFFLRERGEKRNVVMVANEQSPDEIRAKAIELGIVHMHEICVLKAMGGFSGNLFEIISRYKPCLTVIDSLSKLVGRDPDLAVIVASMMKELSVKLNMPTIMVNQVTKDLNHAGQEKLQHEVDMTALGTTIGNKRILESEKNRNGQAPLALAMQMKEPEDFARGEGGLTIMGIVKPPDEDEEDEDEDGEPVARIGEDGENVPGPKRLKQ